MTKLLWQVPFEFGTMLYRKTLVSGSWWKEPTWRRKKVESGSRRSSQTAKTHGGAVAVSMMDITTNSALHYPVVIHTDLWETRSSRIHSISQLYSLTFQYTLVCLLYLLSHSPTPVYCSHTLPNVCLLLSHIAQYITFFVV